MTHAEKKIFIEQRRRRWKCKYFVPGQERDGDDEGNGTKSPFRVTFSALKSPSGQRATLTRSTQTSVASDFQRAQTNAVVFCIKLLFIFLLCGRIQMPGHFNTYLCTLHQQSGGIFLDGSARTRTKQRSRFFPQSRRSDLNVYMHYEPFHRFSIMRADAQFLHNSPRSECITRVAFMPYALKCTPLNSTGLMANVLCRSRLIVVNSLDYFTHILPRTTRICARIIRANDWPVDKWNNHNNDAYIHKKKS